MEINDKKLDRIIKENIKIYTKDNKISFSNKNFILNKLNEGLIKTYPIDKVIRILYNKYNDIIIDIEKEERKDGDNIVYLLNVKLDKNVVKSDIGEIKHLLKTCGYTVVNDFEMDNSNNFGTIIFEPKFTKNITNIIKNECKYLYHLTSGIFLEKIKKNGLIPMSKNNLFSFPDRIYLMKGDALNDIQKEILKNIQIVRNISNLQTNNPNEKFEYFLLKIDISRIPNNVKFYFDPLSENAIFTYNNIPPNAIIKIIPYTLNK